MNELSQAQILKRRTYSPAQRFAVFGTGSSVIVDPMPGKTLQNPPIRSGVFISQHLLDQLIRVCVDALPHKAFGLVGGTDIYHPKTLYQCFTNLRNTPEWKPIFESYGDFYKNPDLGFVITPIEVKAVLDSMDSRRELFVGVFHSHRYLRAQPSDIDIGLGMDSSWLCYIVSTVNLSAPEVGVFRLSGGGYVNIPIIEC
jgi:proteasome lid subunit RPN8/RPN11